MKKSTLITTIAMIVVVVVALSTATYAWFNSATTTTVEQTMSTQAASGWLLYGSTAATTAQGTTTITYDTSAEISLNLLRGLYSPEGTLPAALSGDELSATMTNVKFYKALQNGQSLADTADIEAAPSYTLATSPSNVTGQENVNGIRIVNNDPSSTKCYLSILVMAENADGSKLAGKGFRTYIVDNSNNVSRTAYYYGTVDGSTASRQTKVEKTDNVTYSKDALERDITNTTSADAGYSQVSGANHKFGTKTLDDGQYYYIITIDLGNMALYTAKNIAIYAWFDGWDLFTNASGSTVNIVYSFGGSALTVV